MSALRREWQATSFVIEHADWYARVRYGGPRWEWLAWHRADASFRTGTAPTLIAAQAAAEHAILDALQTITRHEVLLEAANVDCREVRP